MSVRIFIPLMLMLVWGYLYVQDYITLAKMMGNSLNVAEPTIYLLSNSSVSALVYVVCFVLAVCDIPFEDGGLPYYALRIGRRRWHAQIIVFAVVLSLLFVLASVVEGALLCAQAGYFHFPGAFPDCPSGMQRDRVLLLYSGCPVQSQHPPQWRSPQTR